MSRSNVGPAEAGAALAAEAARFASFGWMRGTSGNLSMVVSRDPLWLAVTASGLDKGALTPADIAVVDAAGRPVAAARATTEEAAALARPSAESPLHARVAGITGAGAVVHIHTVAAVVAGRRWPRGVALSDLEMLKGIGVAAAGERVRVPVIGNSQDMVELGDRFAAARDPRVPAVVVADHGLYAWGDDLLKARHHTEVVQWLLEAAIALA
jgi:methylthioribulose-1-phosphate dehydratase